jgi:hypothetical protein
MAVDRVIEARANSNANRLLPKCDVRFTPDSRHVQCKGPCLLWANSGHRRGDFAKILIVDPASREIMELITKQEAGR